jgi:protein O-GlcNAc transferase
MTRTAKRAFEEACAFHAQGRLGEAERIYDYILAFDRRHAGALCNLGHIRLVHGRYSDAVKYLRKAIGQDSQLAAAHAYMAVALVKLGQYAWAESSFRKAIAINPGHWDALTNLGSFLVAEGRTEEAINSFERAIELNPDYDLARWQHCMAQLPVVYRTDSEIARRRAAYEKALRGLVAHYSSADAGKLARAAGMIGASQPFYLPCQGGSDRDLQAIFGSLSSRIMSAAYHSVAKRPPMPARSSESRLRIGFLSGFFREHSDWKLYLRGWTEGLPRDRFESFAYYTQDTIDQDTDTARRNVSHFTQGPMSFEAWCEAISGDNLHMLIIPETGMDPMTMRLAAVRLVPIQVGSWGHPNTSGLPTIDYFLSSDLMEPENAQSHYTEQLVRLANLGIRYRPLEVSRPHLTRSALGMPEDGVLYWCCQSLHKYLPSYDWIFPEIALAVPHARFVFIRHQRDFVTGIFRERLTLAFADKGLSADEHCTFLKRLDIHRFSAATAACDVFLDNIGWSGCTSTLEAIATDIPIVTHRGNLMRGRHSAAMLQMMGLSECIADTAEGLVAQAVRMGQDSTLRQATRERISKMKRIIYEDDSAIGSLIDFIQSAIEAKL